MNPEIHVIITAAGRGERFRKRNNNPKPKQYQLLSGKPVILYSLQNFQKMSNVKSITVSAEAEYFNYLHSLAVKNRITKLTGLVEGGKSRFESVQNAFNQLNCSVDDIVVIHDAARPNISKSELKELLDAAIKNGEVILGCKVSETVKKCTGNYVQQTIPRDDLWLIQTPQAFRYDVLSKSYIIAGKRTDFTDESSLVENAGYKVKIVEGSRNNIKITSPGDLTLLKKIMK
ncbi:MAG: 2-C-methyl-D-erythritol 4-phosphate cytidylyltransferase [Ignavibacteria bacterium]|nr:2-C-methyl-D-erythritol 4-phosphate cytidylyltransferase [Ignavibacteria bacterium]